LPSPEVERADGTVDNIWLSQEQEQIWDQVVRPALKELRNQMKPGNWIIEVRGVKRSRLLEGTELPVSSQDSFLGP
jgi:hypothetical protein